VSEPLDDDPGAVARGDALPTVWRGLTPVPSWFDPGRYRPERPGSSRLAWLLGAGGLLVAPLSVAGVVSGWRAARRGNRSGLAAVAWCVVTAVISVLHWGPLLLGDTWSPPTTFAVEVTDVREGARPPAGLAFAASRPTSSYSEIDLSIRNRSTSEVPLSPSSLEVHDGSGGRLAWATDDAAFLAMGALSAGASRDVRIWVALPAGRLPASIDVADVRVQLHEGGHDPVRQ
jgi:hypothetical protein